MEQLLPRPVGERVERVGDAVAEVVVDPGQAVRDIVGVREKTRVRQCDLRELAYPVVGIGSGFSAHVARSEPQAGVVAERGGQSVRIDDGDRKSTRLNSSHQIISYAVFFLKKKKTHKQRVSRDHVTIAHHVYSVAT